MQYNTSDNQLFKRFFEYKYTLVTLHDTSIYGFCESSNCALPEVSLYRKVPKLRFSSFNSSHCANSQAKNVSGSYHVISLAKSPCSTTHTKYEKLLSSLHESCWVSVTFTLHPALTLRDACMCKSNSAQ